MYIYIYIYIYDTYSLSEVPPWPLSRDVLAAAAAHGPRCGAGGVAPAKTTEMAYDTICHLQLKMAYNN